MLLFIVGFLLGAVWGARVAKSRKGNLADMAQYAVGYGFAFALIGFLISLLLWREFG